MQQEHEILKHITAALLYVGKRTEISAETSIKSLNLSDYELVEFAATLGGRCKVVIPESAIDKFSTIGDMVTFIQEQQRPVILCGACGKNRSSGRFVVERTGGGAQETDLCFGCWRAITIYAGAKAEKIDL